MDLYQIDVAGLTSNERLVFRRLWHDAAKRTLNMLSLTSDPVAAYPVADEDGWFPDHTRPMLALFIYRPQQELVDLYRATKPKRPPAPKR